LTAVCDIAVSFVGQVIIIGRGRRLRRLLMLCLRVAGESIFLPESLFLIRNPPTPTIRMDRYNACRFGWCIFPAMQC